MSNNQVASGTLYLIPTFLGEADSGLLPLKYREIIHGLTHFIVENEKPARAFLKSIETPVPMSDLQLFPIHKHIDPKETVHYLNPCIQGVNMGLISDAGLPCVADPGFQYVKRAHALGITIFPMHGLSSIMMALMASGLNGQQFRFHGYLPHDKGKKKQVLRTVSDEIKSGITQIFIETPYRNEAFINELKSNLSGEVTLSVSLDLSLPTQEILRQPLKKFNSDLSFMHKRPAVFIIG